MTRWSSVLVPTLAILASCCRTEPPQEVVTDDTWGWCIASSQAVPDQPDPLRPATRHAQLTLQVANLDAAVDQILPLLHRNGAFEAGRAPGFMRPPDLGPEEAPWPAITLTLRVEAKHLARMIDAVSGLGTVLDDRRRTADPSEALVGIRATLLAARQNEARIQGLLNAPDTNAGTIAGLEGELAQIRERIAGYAARIYVLENSVDAATLAVRLLSPPVPSIATAFWQDVRFTLLGPDRTQVGFVRHLTVLGMVVLPVVVIGLLAGWLIGRRRTGSLPS